MQSGSSRFDRRLWLSVYLAASSLAAEAAAAADPSPAAETSVPAPATGTAADESAPGQLSEITVTATRQAQSINKVPISISAYSEAQLDTKGIKNISDIATFTPGINFTQGNINNSISIRGIASTAGSATTGIYIDDTPIQVRIVGTSSENFYPDIFDLDHVEVLRGPQGTLFGAGAEGGALRYVLPEPSLTNTTSYVRTELANTQGGAPTYEIGAAQGGPLIDGVLGYRFSMFYRHDGGWISKDTGNATVNDPTGKSGIDSVSFYPTGVYAANANWQDTQVYRLALLWRPLDALRITPSIFYSYTYMNNEISSFWPAASNYSNDNYVTPAWLPGLGTNTVPAGRPGGPLNGQAAHTDIALPGTDTNNFYKDWMALPTLHVSYDVGAFELISNTSYTYRQENINPDYTMVYESTYGAAGVPQAGDFAVSPATNRQQNITEELRAQTPEPLGGRLNVVAGLFFTKNHQTAIQDSEPNFISSVSEIQNEQVPGVPTLPPAVNNGPPFGPGSTAYENYYGVGLLNGVTSYYARIATLEKQEAAFANLDFSVTDELKLTGGVRFSHDSVVLSADYAGPNSNLNTPHGLDCLPGTGVSVTAPCVPVTTGEYAVGTGPFTPAYINGSYGHSENSVTPKYGIEYQATRNDLYYVTVSKGYRPGGAQQEQPSTCNAQLAAYGFVNSQGIPTPPETYKSDSLWSYEIGSKNKLLDGRLQIMASLYHIDWSNIQTSVSLNSCSQSIVDNLGSAKVNGGDLQADYRPWDPLTLGVAFGYTHASFSYPTILGGRELYSAGSSVPGSPPPIQSTISGEYEMRLSNGLPSYVHFDERIANAERQTGATDPQSVNYNPNVPVIPAYHILNARYGVRFSGADISFFINNVTDSHPHLALTENIGAPLYTDMTFRPRTFGLDANYRF
jgi:iron complex outermembrane receptor protein